MEVDPSDDNFYDELASFMPPAGDYNLDDIDEILRYTDSQLDSSIDLDNLVSENVANLGMDFQDLQQKEQGGTFDDYTLDFSGLSATSPSYMSQRTSSISSMDDEHFKTDGFLNFLNSQNIKAEEVSIDNIIDRPQRNTPSPTGSCTSSSGSSTSGIQSDASSDIASCNQNVVENMQTNEHEMERSCMATTSNIGITFQPFNTIMNPAPSATVTSTIVTNPTVTTLNNPMPLTLPILPLSTAPTGTILQPLTQVQSINVLQGTLIPVKTMPVTSIAPVVNIKPAPAPATAPVKVEPKLAPKTTQPIKIVTPPKSTVKVSSPTNSKPKTVYLTLGDYQALMKKMNSNGKNIKTINKVGGQPPIIIAKNTNEKGIKANKIITTDGKTTFAPKIVKVATPLIVRQPSTKNAGVASEATSAPNTKPDFSIFKGIIDEKMLKKQQRMIKNRESASLSRKKKKEYVMSLENRISNLEKENYTLKGENTSLRSQLVAFAQSCHCKNSNVSEFILNSLNVNTKGEHQHVKIAPKPAPGKNMKQRLTASSVKKNVAVLFAMAFMVTLNMGGFKTCFNKNTIESAVEQPEEQVVGRRLLWVETEKEFNEKLNHTKPQVDVPPLHFLRPINRTNGAAHIGAQRVGDAVDPPPLQSKCCGNSNYTENLRLASNLKKWIGGNDYLNLSKHGKIDDDLDNSLGIKVAPEYLKMNSIDLPLQGSPTIRKRKIFMDNNDFETKKHNFDILMDEDKPKNINQMELFKPKITDEYARLFKGIKRRDDTFYVLSFNMDHILLSASSYNKSSRPKMSLMLPAGDPSINGDVVLMQIDCEVLNTTELSLKSDMIPERLRPSKYKNYNFHTHAPNPNDVVNNETNSHRKSSDSTTPTHVDRSRDKPPIRTYLMSSKAQLAAARAQKKNSIIKLHTNEDLVLNKLNNSTLFTKMRETVNLEGVPQMEFEQNKIDLS